MAETAYIPRLRTEYDTTIKAALREHLLAKGVPVGEIIEYPRGIKYAHFSDPDGNSWALQEIPPGL